MIETILVPAITISHTSEIVVGIKNIEQKQGFILRLHLCNGVYLGNENVSSDNNKVFIEKLNTNTEPQRLTMPTVEWVDFKQLSMHGKTINQISKIEKDLIFHSKFPMISLIIFHKQMIVTNHLIF